ncbi:MAG TPA: hypothetical protein VGA23_06230 [Methylomirabilota bacterium]
MWQARVVGAAETVPKPPTVAERVEREAERCRANGIPEAEIAEARATWANDDEAAAEVLREMAEEDTFTGRLKRSGLARWAEESEG